MTDYTIRSFETIEDYRGGFDLQQVVWGPGFSEAVSAHIMKIACRLGGVAAGAWDGAGELVAFVFGLTGLEEGRPVHWSDMLGVRPGLRDSGLGRRLKRFQRDRVMELGVRRMYWTFDPLQSRNAYLNLRKLGIVVREYVPDMYGETDSPLHRGIGTDRFVALWLLDSRRVEARLAGTATSSVEGLLEASVPLVEAAVSNDGPIPVPTEFRAGRDRLRVAIPADLDGLRARSPDLAVRWREATRAALTEALERGWEVRELVRAGPVSHYILERQERPT